MPILSGCCCFDLRVGTKIIGTVYLIGAIVSTIIYLGLTIMIWVLDVLPRLLKTMQDERGTGAGPGATPSTEDDMEAEFMEVVEHHLYKIKIAVLVMLGLCVLSIITSSLLIHGVRKDHRGMLVPWMMQEVLHLLILLFFIVGMFYFFGTATVSWIAVIPAFAIILFQVYFLLVIISQFQALGLIRMHDEMCMK